MSQCINCHAVTNFRYCGECGQDQQLQPLTKKQFLLDIWNTITLVNSPLKHTASRLLFNPGAFVRQFSEGRRKSYLSPVNFFIMVLAIYLIAAPWMIDSQLNQLNVTATALNVDSNNHQSTIALFVKQHRNELAGFIKQSINFFYFILPFSLALFMPNKILGDKQTIGGLKLYAAFYFVGQMMLISLPVMVLSIWFNELILLKIIIVLVYLSYAFANLYAVQNIVSKLAIITRVSLGYLTYLLAVGCVVFSWMLVRYFIFQTS